ncbi:hypothetical protein [Corynebacterium sp.]|uniref:hypothetical protein n=1 Tax=Corynebacterium sp. TaxID=1720 RepID=UPI003B3BA693
MHLAGNLLDTGLTMTQFGAPLLLVCALILVAVHTVERKRSAPPSDDRARMGNTSAAISGVVAGILLWLVWFSWGPPGSIAPVLAVGATVSAFAVLVWLANRTRWPWTGPFTVALGGLSSLTTAYAVDADGTGITGLWALGYLMMTVGGVIVLTVICLGTVVVRSDDWKR